MKTKGNYLIELLAASTLIGHCALLAQTAHVSAVSVANSALTTSVSGSGDSFAVAVAPSGDFVLFTSLAGNLVTNQCDGLTGQLFLRCRTNDLTRLVSVNWDDRAGGDSESLLGAVTPDGRYVVFESDANDLVANDFNNASDIFVRDMVDGVTRLVSVNHAATGSGNGASSDPAITPDGRYVAFASDASDLVSGDANNFPDIFVRDLQTGVTTLVSAGARRGNASLPNLAGSPQITPDGRFIAFTSTGSNLVASTMKTYQEVYVRDVTAGQTIWASTNVTTASGPCSYVPVLSDDGRYVAFKTSAGTAFLILRRDLQTGALDTVSGSAVGVSSLTADSFGPAMTPDGRFVAYSEAAASGRGTVQVWDGLSRISTLASANLNGQPSTNGGSDTPAITPDGRFVTFLSSGTDLVTNSVNGEYHVYLRDLQAGTTKLVSANRLGAGTGDAGSSIPALSADGRFVLFESRSSDLVSGDGNAAYDVFLRDVPSENNGLVSAVSPDALAVTANGFSTVVVNAVSADGRYVVFASTATNLVPGTTNGLKQVYRRDRQTGTTALVSINRSGTDGGDGHSFDPSVNADGRYVIFSSNAENLTANDTNLLTDIFVRDMVTGETSLVSVATNGWSANKFSELPSISADGRWIAFQSPANNLAANDSDSWNYDIFVRDLATGTTILASTNSPNALGLSHINPLLSPNGSFVAFLSSSTSYSDTGARVRNLQTGVTTVLSLSGIFKDMAFSGDNGWLATVGVNGLLMADLTRGTNTLITLGNATFPSSPCVSLNADGRYAAFACRGVLSGTDTNNTDDVFVCDLSTRSITLVSARPGTAVAGNGRSYQPRITADGRLVIFRSNASDLVPNDVNDTSDLFQYDRVTGQITLITHRYYDGGAADGMSQGFALASGAPCIAFHSIASDLIRGDANGNLDVFAADLEASTPSVSVTFPGGQLKLTWPATPILPSRVQYKDSLDDPVWHDLAATVTVTGTAASATDATTGSSAQRFYRLVWDY